MENRLQIEKSKFKFNGQETEALLDVTKMDFRQYDAGLGRFYGLDLLAESTPWATPNHFALNNPVLGSDPTGLKTVYDNERMLADPNDSGGSGGGGFINLFNGGNPRDNLANFGGSSGLGWGNGTGYSYLNGGAGGINPGRTGNDRIDGQGGHYISHSYNMVYPTAAAISLGEMDYTIEIVQWKTWVADGATVYVEKDGIGHVYLEVNNTVFSYGRYDGSYSPSSGAFGPVGPGILNKKPHSYAVERMKKSPTSVYNFPDADASKIYIYLNNLYNSGVPGKNGGMSIDTYLLIGNNCTTITCSALQVGGVNMSMTQTPFSFNMNMQYPNQFPSGMPPR